MTELAFFNGLIIGWFVLAAFIFLYLFFITAPYGRHQRAGWGPTINEKAGWVIMESPSVVAMILFFLYGNRTNHPVAISFLAIWLFHYLYRDLVFPFLLRGKKSIPVVIVASGVFFNCVNAYINGRWLFTLAPEYPISWLWNPKFIIGVILFFTGFAIHFSSDRILRNLRKPGETGHKIPFGGLYAWVSCPNYFGEIIAWLGFTIATWSLPALAFFAWTIANLLPRALSHHKWYKEKFPGYPKERKAILPFIL